MAQETKSSLNALEKSSILLLFLEAEMPGITADILSYIEPNAAKDIYITVENLKKVGSDKLHSVIDEFYQTFIKNECVFGGKNISKELITKAFSDKDKLLNIAQGSRGIFNYLNSFSDEELIDFFAKESRQMTAVLLNFLNEDKLNAIMNKMDTNKIQKLTALMLNLDLPSMELLWKMHYKLDEVLREKARPVTISSEEQINKLAYVFENMIISMRERVFTNLKKTKPEILTEIKKQLVNFEDLVHLSDKDFQNIVYEIRNIRIIALTLQDCSQEMKSKIQANLSDRFQAMLDEELETISSEEIEPQKIQEAKLLWVKTARSLEKQNKIKKLGRRPSQEENKENKGGKV